MEEPQGFRTFLIIIKGAYRLDRGVVDMENEGDVKKEIQKLKMEIGEIKKGIPPHSARFEMIQLLEEKEEELKRKKNLLR